MFCRDILWWFASFIHPLGVAHTFFPLVELWYLPGVNKTLPNYDTMVAHSFGAGTFAMMLQELRWLQKPRYVFSKRTHSVIREHML